MGVLAALVLRSRLGNGDPSDTDSDSESLVKGGAVRFADSAKKSDEGGRRKAEFQLRTTWSGGGNMLEEAERRRQEEKERKKERKEKKVAELARIEAKWAKFAPKGPVKKDPKMLSWDGGFTKAKALEMSLSEDGQDETEATNEGTATLDEREVLDESDDSIGDKEKEHQEEGQGCRQEEEEEEDRYKGTEEERRPRKEGTCCYDLNLGRCECACATCCSRCRRTRQEAKEEEEEEEDHQDENRRCHHDWRRCHGEEEEEG